jgi:hypothetical protein
MYERSVIPHPGFRFWASRATVQQGVDMVEANIREQNIEVEPGYDAVLITMCAQAHALFKIEPAGNA